MALELVPVKEPHVRELARICHEAFGSFHDRHQTPRDFPTPEVAAMVLGMMVKRPDFYGVAALLDGKLVGSNFLQFSDPVAGVGPITVDPKCQARGIGRALMRAVIDEARRRAIAQVRLLQEAINTTSLSLYTSLGFDWRDSVAVLDIVSSKEQDNTVRAITASDLAACDAVCVRNYRNSRRNEVAAALEWKFPGFLREREGRVTGYLLPGFFGHGVAESEDDMLALVGQSAGRVPPPFMRVLLPLSQAGIYRRALGAGCRTVKVMSYMTIGPFETPRAVWLPSIGC